MKNNPLSIFNTLISRTSFAGLIFFSALFSTACSAGSQAIAEQPPLPAEKAISPEQQYPPACQQGDMPIYKIPLLQDNPVKGEQQGALVTIVEFMDFQCPFCHKATATIEELIDDYPGKIRVVFKHNPLPFHKNAMPAAKAAVAAQRQGKFWQMSELLFENGRTLDEDHLFGLASKLGLDMKRFEHDFSDPGTLKIIQGDMELAKTFGVRGTPIFFINGRKLSGAQPLSSFKSMIDELLPKVKVVGGSGQELYQRLTACGLTEYKIPKAKPRPMQAKKNPDRVYDIPAGNSYWIGGQNAKVELIVFSDFQCPYCARLAATLKEILSKYEGKVRIVFKNRPLSFHPNSMVAAEAAMAAGAQGKFWQMHDVIFSNRKHLSRDDLDGYANQLGLDMKRFRRDMDEHRYSQEIRRDTNIAEKFEINGTPTTFINGKKLTGARPYQDFAQTIEKALGH